MKKIWYVVFLMVCALMATSCSSDDDDDVDEAWKEANRVALLAVTGDSNYTAIKSQSDAGSIYVKKIRNGSGTDRIYYNSKVKIHYKGYYYDGTVFDKQYEPVYQDPYEATANSFIDGFTTALQWMKEGDYWEVWIPYQLGYGTSTYGSIPGYSNLKFEIEIVEIMDKPQ